jgi:translation initiation factor IF-3
LNTTRKLYRINYQITSPQLRLLDEEGKQIGVVSKIEALQKARELNLDVVEVAEHATPPVAKLIDFKKFKYQEARKERESKKTQKNVGVKEIRLRPFIGEHDLMTRVKKAQEFLEEGNQVKLNCFFRGRENTRREFGFEVLKKFTSHLVDFKSVREAHFEGRILSQTVALEKKA